MNWISHFIFVNKFFMNDLKFKFGHLALSKHEKLSVPDIGKTITPLLIISHPC